MSASAFASSVVDGQVPIAAGTALASDSEISASSFQSAVGRGFAGLNANAEREAYFIARETGILTLSAPYVLGAGERWIAGRVRPHSVKHRPFAVFDGAV
jgi:hypothetical protein